jgi:hypothetical protein
MPECISAGTVEKGKLLLRNRRAFDKALRSMKDGEVLVRVERVHATRSKSQNAWYWGVIVELISEHTGYTPDEVHELLKAKFIPKKLAVAKDNGEIVGEFVIGGSTRKLNKLTFGEYCEAIRRWAAQDLDIVIPDPEV